MSRHINDDMQERQLTYTTFFVRKTCNNDDFTIQVRELHAVDPLIPYKVYPI